MSATKEGPETGGPGSQDEDPFDMDGERNVHELADFDDLDFDDEERPKKGPTLQE